MRYGIRWFKCKLKPPKNELYGIEFDVAVDHQAVVQIMTGSNKHPPATDRIGLLIDKLLDIPFNLYYVKGKDLILTDFLSRIRANRRNPKKLIPISFMDRMFTHKPSRPSFVKGYDWRQEVGLAEQLYPFTTRSCVQEKGLEMPKVHGHDKQVYASKKPEHQPIPKPQPRQAPPTVAARLPPLHVPPRPTVPLQTPHNIGPAKKPTAAQITHKKLMHKSRETLSKNKPPERRPTYRKPRTVPCQPKPETTTTQQFVPGNQRTQVPIPTMAPSDPVKRYPPKQQPPGQISDDLQPDT